jgi:Heterokaryon incompatibility protein (HET)
MGVEVGFPMPETGGELHFILLREWLRDCNENHSDHGSSSAIDNELPTRVLDVGDAQNPNRLLLYQTKGRRGKYIALSYCWGDGKPISTTKETIEAHRKAIKFDDLPKTLQDAIVITRQLGVQFLWIDSLCIIQDDTDDWRYESERMGKVFASAYCTIAATSAKGSNEGFLIPRSVKQSVRLVDKSAGATFSVYACEVGTNFDCDVENGILNTRGWVLQERALSPRTIHFTKTQTYWECGSVIRCENLTQMAK